MIWKKVSIILIVLIITSTCTIFLLNRQPESPSEIVNKKFMRGSDSRLLCDEIFHFKQIVTFSKLTFSIIPGLTTTPGYNFVVGLIGRVFGVQSVESFRIISSILSLSSVLVFFVILTLQGSRDNLFKTLQFFFFPLVFPFFYLFYTDVSALLILYLSFYFYLRKQYSFVGIFLIAGLAFRQTLIFWFLFFLILLCIRLYDGKFEWSYLKNVLTKSWSILLGILLFALFILVNKGVALGNRGEHPLDTLHFGNVYFCLFLCFILFLPLHVLNIHKIIRLFRERYLTIMVSLVIFGAIFMATFEVDHHFNQAKFSFFLTNKILHFFIATLWGKIIFFFTTVSVILSLYVTELRHKSYYVLYLVSVIALLPHWLIQPRYYIPFYSMFLLFQKDKSTFINWIYLIYVVILSAVLFWSINTHKCFI